jgi:hypothetical protein
MVDWLINRGADGRRAEGLGSLVDESRRSGCIPISYAAAFSGGQDDLTAVNAFHFPFGNDMAPLIFCDNDPVAAKTLDLWLNG